MKTASFRLSHCSAGQKGYLLVRFLLSVAASILLMTGLIKIAAIFGSAGLLRMEDPVFGVRFGILMPLVGITEIAIGVTVLLCRHMAIAAGLVVWLGAEFIAYRFFASELRPGSYCPCLGSLGEFLGLNQAGATWLALVICVTLIVLGLLALGTSAYLNKPIDLGLSGTARI